MSALEDARRFLRRVPALIEAGKTGGDVADFFRVDPASSETVVCLVARQALGPDDGFLPLTHEVIGYLLDPRTGFTTLPSVFAKAVVDDLDAGVVDVFEWDEGEIPIVPIDTPSFGGFLLRDWFEVCQSIRAVFTMSVDPPVRPEVRWGEWERFERQVASSTVRYRARRFALTAYVRRPGWSSLLELQAEGRLVFAAGSRVVIRPHGLRADETTSGLVLEISGRSMLLRADQTIALIDGLGLPALALQHFETGA